MSRTIPKPERKEQMRRRQAERRRRTAERIAASEPAGRALYEQDAYAAKVTPWDELPQVVQRKWMRRARRAARRRAA